LVGLTVVLAISLVFFASLGIPEINSGTGVSKRPPNLTARPNQKPRNPAAEGTDRSQSPPTRERPFLVRLPDEEEMPFDDLLVAIQTAMANHGYVELHNREPYHLREDQPLDFRQSVGKLDIRAAPGITPVIESELKGPNAVVTTGSSVPFEMSGVTIVAHYPEASATPPPPIIMAGRNAKLDRCAFKVASGLRRRDSRAIVSEGDVLEVNCCWFEGFDQAIDVSFLNVHSSARIQQTMIVPAPLPTASGAQSSEWHGWGLKVRKSSQTKTARPQLIIERCTVEGAGLLDLAGSSPETSLQVEVKHCAIKAEALLACMPGKAGELVKSCVRWSGTGNLFDISGRDWIVLSAHEGTPASSIAINDIDSWSKVAEERDPIRAKLTYQVDPAARSNPLTPRDFAIKLSGTSHAQPGANPDLVGPSSNP
jgi:serine/threonine-protein kinase